MIQVETNLEILAEITQNKGYICYEVLANDILFTDRNGNILITDIEESEDTRIELLKM
jgi:hypothetical protein